MRGVEFPTRYLARATLGGEDLEGFAVDEAAASVRLLLPPPAQSELVMPTWDGNVFLLPNGERATIRTFTPRRFDPAALELTLEVVIHEGGAASDWVRSASTDDPAAISGPGRGYVIDPAATGFLLGGDETAIPAIGQLLEALPDGRPVRVLIEVRHPEARLDLPEHPRATVDWLGLRSGVAPGTVLAEAMSEAGIEPGDRIWVAGEAAAMQRVRRDLFDVRGLPRSAANVRGYWKRRGAPPALT